MLNYNSYYGRSSGQLSRRITLCDGATNVLEGRRNEHGFNKIKFHIKIKEGNRERIQVFEGFVLKRQNGGISETFTVRKLSSGIGVEKTFPLHSPKIEKIEVVRRGAVRRAKLNYMRERTGKAAKIKTKE